MYFLKPTDPHPITPAKAVMLGLLVALWLLTGLTGHDPWKPDETEVFGVVYSMLQGDGWLVPMLAGEPYLAHPPLYYWSAALSAKLAAPFLPLHDGARLASGLWMALALLFIGRAGRRLYGDNRGWATVIILIGCIGLLVRGHQMLPDLALLAGLAILLDGAALLQQSPARAGRLIGTGLGIAFLAKGFIAPVALLLSGLLLALFSPVWRSPNCRSGLVHALPYALPWLLLWPAALLLADPAAFSSWLWDHNLGAWLSYAAHGPNADSFYYLKSLPWLAWPALPLAAWVVWHSRHRLALRDDLQLPLAAFLSLLLLLSFVPHIKDAYALPMLLPLALLGAASLSALQRSAANALDWFGLMTFALIAVALWWGWAGLLQDNHAKITYWFKAIQPDFAPVFNAGPFYAALFATLLWLVLVWRVGRSMRRAVTNWAAGITLTWILAMTLWVPWLDSGKSYRQMVASLQQALPPDYRCLAGEHVGDGQRAMLHYFGGIVVKNGRASNCDLRLVQGLAVSPPLLDDTHWKKVWEGSRPGDKGEYFRLYRRQGD